MSHQIESISEIDIEALHELFAGVGPYVTPRTLSDYWLYARLFSPTCLCIRHRGMLAAAVIAFFDQSTDRSEIYIQDVAVSSTSRRLGMAVALLTELRLRAQEARVTRLWLTSEPQNKGAQALWSQCGYTNYPADYQVDGIWMTRDMKGPGRDRAVYEIKLGLQPAGATMLG